MHPELTSQINMVTVEPWKAERESRYFNIHRTGMISRGGEQKTLRLCAISIDKGKAVSMGLVVVRGDGGSTQTHSLHVGDLILESSRILKGFILLRKVTELCT